MNGRRVAVSRTITMINAPAENGLAAKLNFTPCQWVLARFKISIQKFWITSGYLWPGKKVARRCDPLKLNNGCAKKLPGRLPYEIQ